MDNKTAEIVTSLISDRYDADELRRITQALRTANDNLRMHVRRSLYVNQKVRFYDTKRGVMVDGAITKLGPKNAYVRSSLGTQWVVNPRCLEIA